MVDGVLVFTQEPGAELYLQEGSNAVLTWDYTVDDKATELNSIIWKVYNKTYVTLLAENKNGVIQYTSIALSAYGSERLKKVGNATLVLKDITFEDSTNYRCILRGENGKDSKSTVELIVTGNSFNHDPPQDFRE
ncbi:otolith morphogenesis [Desmophyllum pertusum]|uniref:Otolith morphogenesis n=1 Tax=Desmophyllum pertusum TaxID=174260 RepID=A0A9X0CRT4_9CNID|nr:otolith morphogenesis [Desmophyllum pertusum]